MLCVFVLCSIYWNLEHDHFTIYQNIVLKYQSIEHYIIPPLTADRDIRMDVIVRPGELHQVFIGAYHHKALLADVTYVEL